MRYSHCLLAVLAVALLGCSDKKEPIIVEAAQDPAQEHYDNINAIKMPVLDESRASDDEYANQYMAEYKTAVLERGALVFELCKEFPKGDRSAQYFDSHWTSVMRTNIVDGDLDQYLTQINEVVGDDANNDLKRQGAYWSAFISCFRDVENGDALFEHAEGFSRNFASDQRGVLLYNFATVAKNVSVPTMAKAYTAIIRKYSSSDQAKGARVILPLLPNVGKQFEMEFTDPITKKKVTMESLKGKVVVIDFWATWCQPCIQAMPYMMQTYEDLKDKDVEFVGVSMDLPMIQGGLDNLKQFVNINKVPWPQNYVGEDPALPLKYGVESLPTMFILDKKGVIRTVDGYRVLLRTIDELLKE